VSRGRLEARVALWGTRGGLLLAVTGVALAVLLATAWARQARLLSAAVEANAREEADSLGRLLLYDLAADGRVLECRFLERRRGEMRRQDPAVAREEGLSLGLLALVRNDLSLPDAVVWDGAVRAGYTVRLSDIARARYLLYGRTLERDKEALAEDLAARVTVSDHLRGVRLRSRTGELEISAGAPIEPAAARMATASFPLFLGGDYWADIAVLVDRGHLEAVRAGLGSSLEKLTMALGLATALALATWAALWWGLLRSLRGGVVTPITALAGRMEAFEAAAVPAEPESDETAWLAGAFERLVERVNGSREQLRHAQRLGLMERIGAGLSHELNNALNPARLRLDEMLLESAPPSREELLALKEHLLAAQRILKDLSLPGRRPDGPAAPVASESWLGPARRLTAPQFEAGPGLLWRIPAEVPAVEGWPEPLTEVVVNLLLNARDAAAARGAEGRVEVGFGPAGQGLELTVSDNGAGLPAEVRGHLGEPFVTTKPDGTGLGLFVTDLLVRRMGGSLSLEDREGGGTVARVRLKRAGETDAGE